jgi:hypothetical protein
MPHPNVEHNVVKVVVIAFCGIARLFGAVEPVLKRFSHTTE